MKTNLKSLEKALIYALFAVISVAFLFPIFWIISTSFKTPVDVVTSPPLWFFSPTLTNYRSVFFETYKNVEYILNSLVITIGTVVLSLIIGVPAAYALARFQFRGNKDISFWLISTRMAPPIVFAIPLFLLWNALNLLDTYLCMIITYLTFNLPFVIWIMRGFFLELPREVEEAAMVDGCSELGAFLRVALPLSIPGIAATAVLCAIFSWNEFFYALVFTYVRAKTIPVAISGFWTQLELKWGHFMAAGTVIMLPMIVFGLLIQKFLVRGLTLGAVR